MNPETWEVKIRFDTGLGIQKLISLYAEDQAGLAFLQIASLKLQAPIMETIAPPGVELEREELFPDLMGRSEPRRDRGRVIGLKWVFMGDVVPKTIPEWKARLAAPDAVIRVFAKDVEILSMPLHQVPMPYKPPVEIRERPLHFPCRYSPEDLRVELPPWARVVWEFES